MAFHNETTKRATEELFLGIEDNCVVRVRRAFSMGADIFALDGQGMAPLAKAAGHPEGSALVIRELLGRGAHPDGMGRSGPGSAQKFMTPLMLASGRRDGLVAMKALLAGGAGVDRIGPGGETALMRAVKSGQGEKAKALIEAGADVGIADDSGKEPAMVALEGGDAAMLTLLLGAGARTDLAARDGLGTGMAAIAVKLDKVDCLALLISRLAPLDARDANGRTAAMAAASMGSVDHLRLLIDAGADVLAQDNDGLDAFHWARKHWKARCMEMLRPIVEARKERAALAAEIASPEISVQPSSLRM